jgi:hypothetical protein
MTPDRAGIRSIDFFRDRQTGRLSFLTAFAYLGQLQKSPGLNLFAAINKNPNDRKPAWPRLARPPTTCLHYPAGVRSQQRTDRELQLARGKAAIDVYASDPSTTPPGIYLAECKRWRTSVPQAEVQAFRTVIADAGAHFGLFISASGFQSGAFEVVKNTNVHLLDWQQFQNLFLERWCRRYWIPTFRTRGARLADYVDPVGSDAAVREAHGEPLEAAEAVGLFVLDMWGDHSTILAPHYWVGPMNQLRKQSGSIAISIKPTYRPRPQKRNSCATCSMPCSISYPTGSVRDRVQGFRIKRCSTEFQARPKIVSSSSIKFAHVLY